MIRAKRRRGGSLAKVLAVIAANIWHWWIGVILAVVSGLTVINIVVGYLKNVTSKQYPGKRQRED